MWNVLVAVGAIDATASLPPPPVQAIFLACRPVGSCTDEHGPDERIGFSSGGSNNTPPPGHWLFYATSCFTLHGLNYISSNPVESTSMLPQSSPVYLATKQYTKENMKENVHSEP